MKYCLYAWGSPTIVVLLCILLDHIKKGSVGYGRYLGVHDHTISQFYSIFKHYNQQIRYKRISMKTRWHERKIDGTFKHSFAVFAVF